MNKITIHQVVPPDAPGEQEEKQEPPAPARDAPAPAPDRAMLERQIASLQAQLAALTPVAAPEAEPSVPAPKEPTLWPMPTDAAIAAYRAVYQQAQLTCLEIPVDPCMTAQALRAADLALRDAWKVWRETQHAATLDPLTCINFYRAVGLQDFAETQFGNALTSLTVVGRSTVQHAATGASVQVEEYGYREAYRKVTDEDIERIRLRWRAKTYDAWEHPLYRLSVMGGPYAALQRAIEATLP